MTQPLFNSPQGSRDKSMNIEDPNFGEPRQTLPITLSFGDLTIDMDKNVEDSVLSTRQKKFSLNITQKPKIRKFKPLT